MNIKEVEKKKQEWEKECVCVQRGNLAKNKKKYDVYNVCKERKEKKKKPKKLIYYVHE